MNTHEQMTPYIDFETEKSEDIVPYEITSKELAQMISQSQKRIKHLESWLQLNRGCKIPNLWLSVSKALNREKKILSQLKSPIKSKQLSFTFKNQQLCEDVDQDADEGAKAKDAEDS